MTYKIAVASGKGGTGKTTVSVSLYHYLQKKMDDMVHLVDCDVEEPNDIIFFPGAVKTKEIDVFRSIPEIDKQECTYCRKCVSYCEFNAIVVIPPVKFAEVNASLCHSCGACLVACTKNAIQERQEQIGRITFYRTNDSARLTEGRLKIGSAMQTMLIKELKKQVPQGQKIIIYDAPPGTGCPVVETISDADYIILVTEPTPFGLHDLKLMVELVSEIGKPFGVIINKAGLGSNSVYGYLGEKGIVLLGEIPFSEDYASLYAEGKIMENIPGFINDCYDRIIGKINETNMNFKQMKHP